MARLNLIVISAGHKYYYEINLACSRFVIIFVEDNIEEIIFIFFLLIFSPAV